MNIILFEEDEIQNNKVMLTDRRAKHLVKILKIKQDDYVRVGVIDGLKGEGKVLSCSRGYPFQVELAIELFEEKEMLPAIDFVIALPRPIMLKRIFSQAATLGVGALRIIHAARVEKSFWNATLLKKKEYRGHLLQGLEQAVATRVPEVSFHKNFKAFVEQWMDKRVADYSALLLAHPGSSNQLAEIIPETAERILVAVGPEGGWLDYEVEQFENLGFVHFALGERILKVDTAVVSLHGRLALLLE